MNVLKTTSFFRPSSRPESPAPAVVPFRPQSGQPASPLTKLYLNHLIRQPSSQPPSPTPNAAPLVQDGSYLETLSLKLSEAVSKVLAPPNGPPSANEQATAKRCIPAGRGVALGSLITSELNAVHDNPHLHRAVLRSLQRPFTVLVTNLSRQLLPLLSSPSFHSTPNISNQFSFPNPIQLHALSIAKFAEEILQIFDERGLGVDHDVRGDGLKSIREGFASLINRVVNPLITGIRMELIPLMQALEHPNPCNGFKPPVGSKSTIIYHPSIVSLQTLIPVYARALTTYTTSTLSHSTLASLLISVLWKALIALSHRIDANTTNSLTPDSSPSPAARKRASASPSPPPTSKLTTVSAAVDCRVLYDLLIQLPRPSAGPESTRLAKEAVDEAFEGLRTLPTLLDIAINKDRSGTTEDLVKNFNDLTTEIPFLIALPIILRAFTERGMSSVSTMLGIPEEEYRKGCLSGFGRAEECTVTIAHSVMDVLQTNSSTNAIVIRWLEIVAETDDA